MSLATLCTTTATTKRETVTSGKRGLPEAHLTGLLCVPLMPASEEMRNAPPTDAPVKLWETFIVGAQDIIAGDVFTAGGVDYRVKSVSIWPWSNDTSYTRVVLEEMKP